MDKTEHEPRLVALDTYARYSDGTKRLIYTHPITSLYEIGDQIKFTFEWPRASPPGAAKVGITETMLREAYAAGAYMADYSEGKVWKRHASDPDVEPPETADTAVARLLGKKDS